MAENDSSVDLQSQFHVNQRLYHSILLFPECSLISGIFFMYVSVQKHVSELQNILFATFPQLSKAFCVHKLKSMCKIYGAHL